MKNLCSILAAIGILLLGGCGQVAVTEVEPSGETTESVSTTEMSPTTGSTTSTTPTTTLPSNCVTESVYKYTKPETDATQPPLQEPTQKELDAAETAFTEWVAALKAADIQKIEVWRDGGEIVYQYAETDPARITKWVDCFSDMTVEAVPYEVIIGSPGILYYFYTADGQVYKIWPYNVQYIRLDAISRNTMLQVPETSRQELNELTKQITSGQV